MKKKNGTLLFCFCAALFMALAMTVEQILVYIRYYRFDDLLWAHATPVVIQYLVYLMLLVTLLFAAAAALTVRGQYREEGKSAHDPLSDTTRRARVASLLVGLSLLSLPVVQLCVIGSWDHLNLLIVSDSSVFQGLVAFFHVASLLLAFPAAFFFLRELRGKKRTYVSGLFFVFFLIAYLLRLYFDMTVKLNNPRRMFSIVTLLAMLLYALCELRLTIEPRRIASYTLITVTATVLSAANGFSNLFLNLIGRFQDGAEVAYYLLQALFSLYLVAKLLFLILPQAPKSADAPQEALEEPLEEALVTSGEAASDAPSTEEAPLTRQELSLFYASVKKAIYARRALAEDAIGEDAEAAKEEIAAIVSDVLHTADAPLKVRAFLQGREKSEGVTPDEENA